jgi:hypothetical protein
LCGGEARDACDLQVVQRVRAPSQSEIARAYAFIHLVERRRVIETSASTAAVIGVLRSPIAGRLHRR